MQKKRSAAGIFFSFFFRAVVVILAIVIVALSVVLVRGIIKGKKLRAKNENKTVVDQSVLTEQGDHDELLANTGEQTEEPDTSDTSDGLGDDEVAAPSENCKIVVLNATEVNGLAGSWTARLQDAGYTDVSAANSYTLYDHTSILVSEEGMGTDLLKYFPGAEISVGTLTEADTDAELGGVQIFIIVGASDSGE